MVFKEPSLDGELGPKSNNIEVKQNKIFKTEKERFELAENTRIDSMPASVLNLSQVVRGELEYFIKKNFSRKQIEEVSLGEIVKNYDKLENLWKKNYFIELDTEIKHCKDASREFINKNKL